MYRVEYRRDKASRVRHQSEEVVKLVGRPCRPQVDGWRHSVGTVSTLVQILLVEASHLEAMPRDAEPDGDKAGKADERHGPLPNMTTDRPREAPPKACPRKSSDLASKSHLSQRFRPEKATFRTGVITCLANKK
ncbi:hypothetical protein B0H14DRAFT_2574508 [Mycena olivaceomarginata]|nr:hypothetical protein B0H14DRAFT_2574508 [Mycena olivaceomarginata]